MLHSLDYFLCESIFSLLLHLWNFILQTSYQMACIYCTEVFPKCFAYSYTKGVIYILKRNLLTDAVDIYCKDKYVGKGRGCG